MATAAQYLGEEIHPAWAALAGTVMVGGVISWRIWTGDAAQIPTSQSTGEKGGLGLASRLQ